MWKLIWDEKTESYADNLTINRIFTVKLKKIMHEVHKVSPTIVTDLCLTVHDVTEDKC